MKSQRIKFCTATIVLVTVNILIFLYTNSPEHQYLLDKGAVSAYSVLNGDIYRIFFSMFLHSDTGHIVSNMLVLALTGGYLEMGVGKRKFLFIYFASGIIANLASIVFNIIRKTPYISAVGASGAIFGIEAALFIFLMRTRSRKNFITIFTVLVALCIYTGLGGTGVDNMAHLMGMITGLCMGLLFCYPEK